MRVQESEEGSPQGGGWIENLNKMGLSVKVRTNMFMWLYKEHRAHQQEGQSTLAGGGPPVPVTRELNWSTREELEGLTQKCQRRK